MQVTTKLNQKKTIVTYYYAKLSYTTGLPKLNLYRLDSDSCLADPPIVTLTKRRCLTGDNTNSENAGRDGRTSRPWLMNSGASLREAYLDDVNLDTATGAGSAQRYRELFGWIDFTTAYPENTSLGRGALIIRRMWAWDPVINRYMYAHITMGSINAYGYRNLVNPNRLPLTTEQFNTFNGYASRMTSTLNSLDRSFMPFWDPVLLLGEAMRNYGNGLGTSAEQIAAISNTGSAGVRSYTQALENYRSALEFIRDYEFRNIWYPNNTNSTLPPGGYGTTKPGDNSTNPGGGSGSLNPPGGSGSSNPPAGFCSV
jgi:hypothetical protein